MKRPLFSEIRLEQGLKIIELATKTGVCFGAVVRIERGLPTTPVAKRKIAKALYKRQSDIDFNLSYKLP
jgi:transcriptional regulator with XRE-family HTH domain